MEKLTTRDHFEALERGDRVYVVRNGRCQTLDVVGRMPTSEDCYLILCKGEHTEHLYFGRPEGDDRGEIWKPSHPWFKGEYDSKVIGEELIKYYEKRIESVRRVYMEDES